MAITNYEVTSSVATAAFTASADTAVTVIYLCNINTSTPDGDASVDVYVVPSYDGSTTPPVKNKIYSGLTVPGGDTFVIDTEKLILNNGDAIFIATPDSTGQVKATISTIGL